MDEFDDDLDYELSQLDIPECFQECNTLSNSDALQVLDIDLDDTVSIPRTIKHNRRQIVSDSEDDQISILPALRSSELWFNPLGKQPSIIPYTEYPGLKPFSLRSIIKKFQKLIKSNQKDHGATLVINMVTKVQNADLRLKTMHNKNQIVLHMLLYS